MWTRRPAEPRANDEIGGKAMHLLRSPQSAVE